MPAVGIKNGRVLTPRRVRLLKAYKRRHSWVDWYKVDWSADEYSRFRKWESEFLVRQSHDPREERAPAHGSHDRCLPQET